MSPQEFEDLLASYARAVSDYAACRMPLIHPERARLFNAMVEVKGRVLAAFAASVEETRKRGDLIYAYSQVVPEDGRIVIDMAGERIGKRVGITVRDSEGSTLIFPASLSDTPEGR